MTPVQERFAAALELRELTIDMHRQLLRREYPDEAPEEIDRRLRSWVLGLDTDSGPPGNVTEQ